MALDSATYLADFVTTNPPGSDNVSQGDDHLRLIKTVLQNTFPTTSGVFTALAHTWTVAQTFSLATAGAVPLVVISTEAGAALGPIVSIYRNSASPADADVGGGIQFHGKDSAGNQTIFAQVHALFDDITNPEEDGSLHFSVVTAGTLTSALIVSTYGLELPSAAAIDFASGNVTITHATDELTIVVDAGLEIQFFDDSVVIGGDVVIVEDKDSAADLFNTIIATVANASELNRSTDYILIRVGGTWKRITVATLLD
jgi:hypothetical protein